MAADQNNELVEPNPLEVRSREELEQVPPLTPEEIAQALEQGRLDRDGALANTNTQLGNPRVLFREPQAHGFLHDPGQGGGS